MKKKVKRKSENTIEKEKVKNKNSEGVMKRGDLGGEETHFLVILVLVWSTFVPALREKRQSIPSLLLCFFHKLKGSQVTIWNNYWDQSSWLSWVSGITQMWNFMAHNKCKKKKRKTKKPLNVDGFHFT